MRLKPLIFRGLPYLLLSAFAVGAAARADDDPAPAPLNARRYEELWSNSPFTRPLNAAESYVLTSVTRIAGEPVVTILNTETGERFMLTNEKNPLGWSLVDLVSDPDPRNVMARVSINGEEMGVRFHDGQLGLRALMKAADGPGMVRQRPASGGQGGKPAAQKPPGQGKNEKKQGGKNQNKRQKKQ